MHPFPTPRMFQSTDFEICYRLRKSSGKKVVPQDGALQRHDRWRIKFFPATNIGEVAQHIVEVRSEIVIHSESFLDQLLGAPLEMFEALRYAMNVDAQSSENGRSNQTTNQLRNFKRIPGSVHICGQVRANSY